MVHEREESYWRRAVEAWAANPAIQVLGNTYSVPARLIGATVLVRARSETLELYRGTAKLLTLPRLLGRGRQRIDYRHLIWSLVRKPGAFANYRYHDDLFPTLTFRRAYDALATARPPGRRSKPSRH